MVIQNTNNRIFRILNLSKTVFRNWEVRFAEPHHSTFEKQHRMSETNTDNTSKSNKRKNEAEQGQDEVIAHRELAQCTLSILLNKRTDVF